MPALRSGIHIPFLVIPFLVASFILGVLPGAAEGQDPNYQLTLDGPATLDGGASFTGRVLLDNQGADIAGWSFGVCHDPTVLSLDGVADGATTQTINQGGLPDFNDVTVYADGFTAGVVICFASCATLAPGTLGAELSVADYTALVAPLEPEPAVATTLSLCDTLGSPPIAIVVTVDSNSITPTTSDLALTIPSAPAIDPDITLRLSAPALVATGDPVDIGIRLDNLGADIAGWSFGVCLDDLALSLDAIDSGATTLTVKNGAPADFIENTAHAGGFTSGVVICFTACAFLPAGTLDADLAVAHCTAVAAPPVGNAPVVTPVSFCDTLGTPPITTVVTVNSNSVVPTQQGTSVAIEGRPPTSFEYSVDPIEFRYFVPSAPVATPITAHVRITQTGIDPAIPTQGFSMGMSHDPARLTALAVSQGDALLAIGATGPEFIETAIHPQGWTAAVIYSLSEVMTLAFDPGQEVLRIDYTTVATGFEGVTETTNVALVWDDSLGSPPVTNVVVKSDGTGEFPILLDGAVPMEPQFSGGFVRGDTNGDGVVQMTDVVWLLADLFQGGPTTRDICYAANDTNGDGLIHLADPVFLLNYLFAAGAAPVAPFPACGVTTEADCTLPGFCAP